MATITTTLTPDAIRNLAGRLVAVANEVPAAGTVTLTFDNSAAPQAVAVSIAQGVFASKIHKA